MRIAGQTIELGDHELGAGQSAKLERLRKLRTIALLAALNLDKLLHEPPIAAIEEVLNRLALSLKAETG